jgi:hypothetical protein
MKKSIITQLSLMVARRDFRLVFTCVLALTLYSFVVNLIGYSLANTNLMDSGVANLLEFRGSDYSSLYSWHFLYAGNTNSKIWPLFSVLYPFIVVFPFGFSYMQDRNVRLLNHYILKSGKKNYFRSKLIAAFIGGFLIIAIPFAINLLLNYATFPHTYHSPLQYEQLLTGDRVDRDTVFGAKPFAGLFTQSLFLYNMLYLLFFSLFTGLLSAFSMALSFLIRRRKILLFVPLFVLFQLGFYLNSVIFNLENVRYFNTDILSYFATDSFYGQSVVFISILLGMVVLFIVSSYRYAVHREDIS